MSRRRNNNPNVLPRGWAHDFEVWATNHNVTFAVKNDGEHVICEAPGVRCEYWPSTGRVVWNRRFKHATHERDHRKVMEAIEKRLPRQPKRTERQPTVRTTQERPGFLDYREAFRTADLGYLRDLVMGAV